MILFTGVAYYKLQSSSDYLKTTYSFNRKSNDYHFLSNDIKYKYLPVKSFNRKSNNYHFLSNDIKYKYLPVKSFNRKSNNYHFLSNNFKYIYLPIKMSSNEIVYFIFIYRMHVLKFMQSAVNI